ncbi:MAG: CHAT domain-containing protein [Leptolyngbyaceae cyanobacterium bins.349]|nr:CHAT domain-containing protein [Leptolyngbyaceae cyanobacterium bins.349]
MRRIWRSPNFRPIWHRFRQFQVNTVTVLLSLFLVTALLPSAIAQIQPEIPIMQAQATTQSLEQQAQQAYESGQFTEAVQRWQQVIAAAQANGDQAGVAIALSNLSLTHQQLHQWQAAQDAITQAIALLNSMPHSTLIYAQTLDVQGRLHLALGQAETALATWQQAATLYSQLQDQRRLTRNRINQAQALQTMGHYQQAQKILTESIQALQREPDSLIKAKGLRSLGNVLRAMGDLERSREILQQSLKISQNLADWETIGEAFVSLGNTARLNRNIQLRLGNSEQAQQNVDLALEYYQQAEIITAQPTTYIQALLNQFSLLLEQQQFEAAIALQAQIHSQLCDLPASRAAIFARVNYARNLLKLSEQTNKSNLLKDATQVLATAVQQARGIADSQAEAYAIGTLGTVYEKNQQFTEAQALTQQAALISRTIKAVDIAYQWQWQLGRILWVKGEIEGAIAAYSEAVKMLQSLRSDLVTLNPDVQFSFRDNVEPVYRQYVELLLQPEEPEQDNLRRARQTIEALQLAELDNFLREACLRPRQQLDQVLDTADPTAAAIYPIILRDRIEVILKLPQQQQLRHFSTRVNQKEAETTLTQLRKDLQEPDAVSVSRARTYATRVYDWLIQPWEAEFAQHHIKSLIFVLDSTLRNIPMAALYDGEKYLVEKYSIGLTPGLQLVNPKPLQQIQLKVLAAGISESRDTFSSLPNVKQELADIQAKLSGSILLNQNFTSQTLRQNISLTPVPIVHLATHGQFHSDPEQTFILAWDKRIRANELPQFFRTQDENAPAIELLVLSACETAQGDQRAALGMAGVTIRAGARSAIASLWLIDDRSASELMNYFYRGLVEQRLSKAEALRQAQMALLKQPTYRHPRHWAPYVLIGNWM